MSTTDTADLPRQLFDTLQDAATSKSLTPMEFDGKHVIVLPRGHSLATVEDPGWIHPDVAEAVEVDDRESLVTYTNRFQDERTIITADYDRGEIIARIDWHSDSMEEGQSVAQAATHMATLKLGDSEEYQRWNAIQNKLVMQDEFAEFLDENAADIHEPSPAEMIEVARDLEVIQGASFKSGTRLDNGDRTFLYESDTQVKGEVKVPTEFSLNIPLYHGEEPMVLNAKFRFRPKPDALYMGFVWHRVEYQRRAVFNNIAHSIAEATGRPVIHGRRAYSPEAR